MIIIGLDPGTATTGYGIIRASKKGGQLQFVCLDFGCIKTSPEFLDGERLKKIEYHLGGLIKKFKPDILAVEKIFFFKNLKTVIPVSQAKGVILLTAAKKQIAVFEFTPLFVKMNLTGYGRAQKPEIQKTIKKILKLKEIPKSDDAADALGVAICCALHLKSKPGI